MKRLSKKIWTCIFVLLFFATNISSIEGNYIRAIPINLAITNIVCNEYNYTIPPKEDYSYFNFTIEYIIHNPSFHKVIIGTPCTSYFEVNMTVELDNKNLDIYQNTGGYLPTLSKVVVEPGITYKRGMEFLGFNETGIIALPDGIYTFQMFLYGVSYLVNCYETVMRVEEGNINIKYGKLPISESPELFTIFWGILIAGFAITLSSKMERKRKK